MARPPLRVPIGERVGHLTVVGPAPSIRNTKQGRNESVWLCRCDCGNEKEIRASSLRAGKPRSCGSCDYVKTGRPPKHGGARDGELHPLYQTWCAMRRRCQAPSDPAWKYYGGRGIKVCEQWEDFALFAADMGERPEGMTLDRIDNNGNYEPGNVRFATAKQQRHNRRDSGG